MSEELKSIYSLVSNEENILCMDNEKQNEKINCFPVISFGGADKFIAITETGHWGFKDRLKFCIIKDNKDYKNLLYMLKNSYEDIQLKVSKVFECYDLKKDIFPFYEITKAGFDYGSEYWAKLSMKWLTNLPVEKKVDLINSLNEVELNKTFSYELRSKARNIKWNTILKKRKLSIATS